ncbi:DNA topoisomerase 2-binding protein 1 [Paragonimus heterotremus]|uniref:DNA topoisomerase 2-binding protein 1 n=1 Tax=Paragonimus heterotremus TaxID=100268 RepID=A0A8J4SRH6_9TREM|nr:DNA topoisomerase 2-binding protein 1 [Paragonimus heterotremus]
MNEDKYEIVFVNDFATPLLSAAFDAVSSYENLSILRLDALEVLNRYTVRSLKRTSFVFCRFEGECFERLRSMGASIYGPQIILHYVRENKPLPKTSYPLYSTALIGAIATVTSVTGPEREYLLSSIQALHGQASRDLFDGVNVVITPKVGSKKYLVGASRGLHILLPSWIKEAWKLSAIQDPIDMMLPTYTEKFRVPIFSQLIICVSGLSAEERKEVSDLVLKHGGRYSGMMKVGETTHLIVKQAVGLKYSHAKKWKIQIVGVRWLIDSVNKGYAVNEEDYRVPEGKDHSSTPTCEANKVSLSFDNISVISHASSTTTRVDETRNDYLHAESILLPMTNNTTVPVLSNCLISLTDCTKDEVSLYSKLIEELGGQLCAKLHDQVSEALTHVIVGSANPASKPTLEPDILYVKGSWLVASRDAGRRVPESDHFFSEANDSTLSVKGDEDVGNFKPAMDTEDLKLINQYFGSGGLADVDDFTNGVSGITKVDKHLRSMSVTSISADLTVKLDVSSAGSGIFRGLIFFLHDALSKTTKEEIGKRIISSGGNVSVALPDIDFIVAPFFVSYLPELPNACKLVTPYWVDRCVSECSILFDDLATEKAFTPIVRSGTPPLTGCVISLSGFIGKDRTLLTAYAQALGAIVQECFLRKPVPSRNLAASTHLIAAKPDGRKWPAAQLWGLPAVNRSWLYACAELWTKVEESEYPVQIQSENKDENSGTINQRGTPTVSTDNRALLEIQLNNAHVQNEEYAEKPLSTSVIDQQKAVPNSLADALRTPDWVCNNQPSTDLANASRDSLGRIHKPSPPLSEQVARCLKKAVCRTAALPKRKLDLSDEDPEVLPLKDVVICVAKHLSARQVELNGVARQLGGDFKWIYDPQVCTHMIADYDLGQKSPNKRPITPSDFSANQRNLYGDVVAAKNDGKFVVCPKWLTACLETSRRLPEDDYLSSVPMFPQALETSTDSCQPSRKFPRIASSDLLGDVSRRLELMMGAHSKSATCEGSQTALSPDIASMELTEINRERSNQLLNVSGNLDPTIPGPRRFRRNPRRVTQAASSNGSVGVSLNSDSGDRNELAANSKTTIDKAQPGQSVTVRWQYEDTDPRSSTDGICLNGLTSLGHGSLPLSSMSSNPGQGIIGIESITARDQTIHRESSAGLSTDDKSTLITTKPANAKESIETNEKAEKKSRHVISFSGLAPDVRDHYANVVSQLGGEVDNQLTISEETTHLIVHTPTRSEKYLICLATGKWILHKSYLDACQRESRWVDETNFEWGGPGTEPLLMQLSPAPPVQGPGLNKTQQQQRQQAVQIRELARSARRWRLAGGKAFQNWRVVFGPGCDKETSFRRVIEAGGGQVLASGPPYPSTSLVTHAFYKRRPNVSMGANQLPPKYEWLRIDYLSAYLTTGHEISRKEFTFGNT